MAKRGRDERLPSVREWKHRKIRDLSSERDMRGGMGGRRGGGKPRVVIEERKKREWERPTDRRMRPGEVFNCEESWDFVSLGAVLPSIDGRRNTVLPAQLSPFQDMSLLHAFPAPPTCRI